MSNRRAQRPLDASAVALANDALWGAHPELGGRQLTMGPEDAALRKEWMDAYVALGGKVEEKKPDTPTNPVQQCPSPPPPPPPPPCSAETIKTKFDACDGGTNLWNDAKTTLGKDPTVQVGPVPGGFEANTDVSTGLITIAPTTDCCNATASLFFELTNAKSSKRHLAIDADAAAGNLSRDDYAKKAAEVEYDGVKLLRDNFAKCKARWGCSAAATSGYENVSDNFDTYYTSQTEKYKDYYRTGWDSSYKAAYDAKHPATP
jgi:hypothetical protein